MDEVDGFRFKRFLEDSISVAPSSTDSAIGEDDEHAALRGELESDAQEFEAETWSCVVDPQYLKTHQKEAIKRQDVIYELMQTEVHHVRTLKLLLQVYARELRTGLQMEEEKVERLFPQVENLLEIHSNFLLRLKERRRESLEPGSQRNYAIQRLGDVLIAQFSGELGDTMTESYGEFCSHHSDAVSFYKEQLQSSKRFQNVIRKISNLSIVRRLGIPECILLVTQRITKYPVLVERILHNTEAGTVEQQELARALGLIKERIGQVDGLVSVSERAARLRDIASRVEPKSQGRMKDGRVFRREDLAPGRRTLLHEATVTWKAASGRLKDVLAVLCSDVVLLLQEKDQKYTFSTVDSKPSVISLQKLIVREVAHEEKAMFLICASSAEPEMYEIHTSSKEECSAWMSLIRQAVESCPHVEEELFSEQEEARALKLRELQERLTLKDAQIAQSLLEKLQIFADLTGLDDGSAHSGLLLRGDSSDLQQGEQQLKGAITEVENLQNLLLSARRQGPSLLPPPLPPPLPRRSDTFGGYDCSPPLPNKNGVAWKKISDEQGGARDRSQRATSDPQLKELEQLVEGDTPTTSWTPVGSSSFPEPEFFERVLMLSQRLYTLQAIVVQQDSHIELQRAWMQEQEGVRAGRGRGGAGALLEQEKQRNLERQREEMARFQRLQSQQQQERARWERERVREEERAGAREEALRGREEGCGRLEARLREERVELEAQREQYQQDLERLRESTRAVEKERERLQQQSRLRKNNSSIATDHAQAPPKPPLFNGDFQAPKPHLRPTLSIAPGDQAERPPEVPPRRESMLVPKAEPPIHLISATNQLHKQSSVRQQIPTKLALGRRERDHNRSNSASLDLRQILPMKLSGKDEGSLRGRFERSSSPHPVNQPDPAPLPVPYSEVPPPPPAHAPSFHRHSAPTPPYTAFDPPATEDVIFF